MKHTPPTPGPKRSAQAVKSLVGLALVAGAVYVGKRLLVSKKAKIAKRKVRSRTIKK